MQIDHEKFFSRYRDAFGPLKQSQVDGLEALLKCIEQDNDIKDLRWAAYMLATVKHECADTWRPIEEYGKGQGRPYGKSVAVHGSDGCEYNRCYYGRGYVQLTWKDNYQTMSSALGLKDKLVVHPELALEPGTAYAIMSYGMRHGSFTGKKLGNYINDQTCDYRNARKIINGLDQCDRIKGFAEKLEAILRASVS